MLDRLRKVSNGVPPHSLYAGNSSEIEEILSGLARSFRQHGSEETADVAAVLASGVGVQVRLRRSPTPPRMLPQPPRRTLAFKAVP